MNSVQSFGLCFTVFQPFSVAQWTRQDKTTEVNYYVHQPGSTFNIVVIVILGRDAYVEHPQYLKNGALCVIS